MRFASHALATCAPIAGLALLASTASAQLPSHLPQLTVSLTWTASPRSSYIDFSAWVLQASASPWKQKPPAE
jgi:hypothetical protein